MRAEERLLQQAIQASLLSESDPLSPSKTPVDHTPGLASLYNPILRSQGRSDITPIVVEKLPSAVHSDGFGVLGPEEVECIKSLTEGHTRFMKSKVNAPIIAHLLGRDNLELIDSLVSSKNIRECEINQNFRL